MTPDEDPSDGDSLLPKEAEIFEARLLRRLISPLGVILAMVGQILVAGVGILGGFGFDRHGSFGHVTPLMIVFVAFWLTGLAVSVYVKPPGWIVANMLVPIVLAIFFLL